LKDEYATYMLRFFQRSKKVMILDTSFRVESLAVNCKSYEQLEKDSSPADALTLSFKTPTYFASLGSKFHWMFPDATKTFCGLMRCWNLFSNGRGFDKESYVTYKKWLEKRAGVGKYDLRTKWVVMGRKKATGFVGWVTYELEDTDDQWKKVTCMLAKFAEYANVGGNKTGGFGVTKFVTALTPRSSSETLGSKHTEEMEGSKC
jgi:CRISPR-associated endoribonuclease Cas6